MIASACVLALITTSVQAQAPTPPAKKLSKGTLKLSFDRETFSYPGTGRVDPFRPQEGTDAAGPLFEDLTLRGIFYFDDPKLRLVSISDGSRQLHRLRIGDVVGNSRVSAIERDHVRMLVQSYGFVKEDTLNLAQRRTPEQIRAGEQESAEQQQQRLFQQELIRILTDTARVRPTPRRDTTSVRARGRGGN